MLADRYPQGGKVRVIDSLAASSGFGLLAECAADVRDSGASLDETAAWIEEHKLNLHHWFFSTDLSSYLRGGRISAAKVGCRHVRRFALRSARFPRWLRP